MTKEEAVEFFGVPDWTPCPPGTHVLHEIGTDESHDAWTVLECNVCGDTVTGWQKR